MPGWRWQALGHPTVEDGTIIRFTFSEWLRVLRYGCGDTEPHRMVLPGGKVELFRSYQMTRR